MGRSTAAGKPASNKREAVLAAAVSCFAARGLAGTGMRDVARAAGLTEGTLYHYFTSKDALIDAAFRWSAFDVSEVRAALQRELPLRQRLLAVAGDFLATLRRRPDWTRVVLREALRAPSRATPQSLRAALVPLAAGRARAVTAALRREMTAGTIRRCDPRRVADHLFRALIGHFVAEAIGGPARRRGIGADPFVVHLVDTIDVYLAPRGRSPSSDTRKGRGKAPRPGGPYALHPTEPSTCRSRGRRRHARDGVRGQRRDG
jgi:AcrR family transcriptional regulator